MLRYFKNFSMWNSLKCNKKYMGSQERRLCQQYTKLSESDGVREICLNEPKSHNSLSLGMLEEIIQQLHYNWDDKSLRCIVISSTGPVWSAGHDLKELISNKNVFDKKRIFEMLYEVTKTIQEAPVPVIAKVNGLVAAGGIQLVSSCDMVICSNTSEFVIPSANLGIFASTPVVPMSRLMSHNKCLDMIFTGHPISAEDAIKYGLVSRVVLENKLDKEMEKIISSIKFKSRSVLAFGKAFFYKQLDLPRDIAYNEAINKMMENLKMRDTKEGIASFMEKRTPNWSHL